MPDKKKQQAPATSTAGMTYSESGVDLDRARQAKARIKELARSTFGPQVVQDIGSFAGLYRPDFGNHAKPLLVSSADGVGTKLKIAFLAGIHNTVGLDLVAHCVGDLLAQRARPWFFLDYIATGQLAPDVVAQIIEGLAAGCRQAGCALLGGETAEMPDFYSEGEYDLAGFIVGAVDEERLFEAEKLSEGDILLGLPSSGLHTNGFSLVRRLFFGRLQLTVDSFVGDIGKTLGEELLTPHRNYLPILAPILDHPALLAMAHITGGGLTYNLDRVLPAHLDAVVETDTWSRPPIFRFIQERGRIAEAEMFKTFNMGIGMVLAVRQDEVQQIEQELKRSKRRWWRIGHLEAGKGQVRFR